LKEKKLKASQLNDLFVLSMISYERESRVYFDFYLFFTPITCQVVLDDAKHHSKVDCFFRNRFKLVHFQLHLLMMQSLNTAG